MKRQIAALIVFSMLLCACAAGGNMIDIDTVDTHALSTGESSTGITDTDSQQTDSITDAEGTDTIDTDTDTSDNDFDTDSDTTDFDTSDDERDEDTDDEGTISNPNNTGRLEDSAYYDDDEYIRTPKNVLVEMYSTSFWTSSKYDKVVMTPSQIARYNKNAASELGSSKIGYWSLNTVEAKVSRAFVKDFIEWDIPNSYAKYYVGGETHNYSWWSDVISNANMSGIASSVSVKYGYSVDRATLRKYPIEEFITNDIKNTFDDLGCNGALHPYERLIVIHESADGKWYYVLMSGASGWVYKDSVALCKNRTDWINRSTHDDFLVVTGKELRIVYDHMTPEFSNLLLPMGTVLPLVPADKAPKYVNNRLTYGNYVVKLPTRGSDGYIVDKYALIPYSSDVSVGYLPYTRNNVIALSFKFLGDVYGLKNSMYSVNCSGLVREVYACFGLYLPTLATNQQRASGQLERIVVEDLNCTEKQELLKTIEPGALLYFSGHIMMYLGEYEGEYYVISATGGYHDNDMGETEVPNLYNVSINTLDVFRSNGLTWLESLWSIQLVRYAN